MNIHNWKENRRFPALLAILALLNCGFTWGFGHTDPCEKASGLARGLSATGTEKEKLKIEDSILKLCPDGAGSHFINALREERQGHDDGAIAEYRKTLQSDDSFAEAHGSLGLLLLKKGNKSEASVELSKALLVKTDPRYHKGLASILMEAKLYPLALFHYGEALKKLPGDADVLGGMAGCHKNLGDFDLSEKEFKRVLEIEPGNKSARLDLAEVLVHEKRPVDARKELNSILAEDSRNLEAHRLMAEMWKNEGDMEAARKEYLLAGIIYNIDPKEYVRQGDVQLAASEYDKAIAAYQAVLRTRPDWQEVREKLGNAQMAAGRNDEAIASYLKVAQDGGPHSEICYNLGVLYERKGQLDEAVKSYLNCLRRDSANGDARRRLADIYFLRGDFTHSGEAYSELIKQNGTNPLLHMKLAKTYEKEQNYPGAFGEYQEAIKLAPDNLQARRELAILYRNRGMVDEATEQYREVLRLKKDDRDARNALMAIYVRKQNYDALARLLEEGVELFPGDPDSHYKLGLFYEFKKQYDGAIGQYQQAVKIKSDHARALNALGRVYFRTGVFSKAKEALEAARKADPNLKEPQEMLADIREDSTLSAPAREIHANAVSGHKSKKTHSSKKHKSKKSMKSGHAGGRKKKKNLV